MSRIVGLVTLLGAVLLAVWLMGSEVAEVPDAGAATEGRENASPVADLTATTSPGTSKIERGPVEEPIAPLEKPAEAHKAEGITLFGRVVDPDGNPVPFAQAGMTTMTAGIPDQSGIASSVECDGQGDFWLPVPEDAKSGEILLTGRADNWRPAWRRLWLEQPPEEKVILEVEAGFELAGRVIRNGEPVYGAILALDLRFGTDGVFGMGEEAFWIDGRLEEKVARTKSAQDGTFHFGGLAPQEYTMHVGPPGDLRLRSMDFTRHVRAPNHALEVDVSTAELVVHVHAPHGPVSDSKVDVRCQGSGTLTSRSEPLRFQVRPNSDVTVTVEHPNAPTATIETRSPGAGQAKEITVCLDWVIRPSITLQLDGATDAGVRAVPLVWYSPERHARRTSQANSVGHDEFVGEAVPVDPGRYELTIGPGPLHSGSGFVMPMVVEVDVPESGQMFVRRALKLVGLCSVSVESNSPDDFQATVSLVDATGHTRWQREMVRETDGIVTKWSSWSSGASGDAPDDALGASRRSETVPEGPYTLRVEASGHEPYQVEVRVEGGRINRFEAKLVPHG